MPLVHRYHHSQGRLSFSDVYSEVTGKEHPGFNSSVWLASRSFLKGSNFNQRIKPVLSQLQDSVVQHCFYVAAT